MPFFELETGGWLGKEGPYLDLPLQVSIYSRSVSVSATTIKGEAEGKGMGRLKDKEKSWDSRSGQSGTAATRSKWGEGDRLQLLRRRGLGR